MDVGYVYPFTAIVGQEQLKLSLVLNAVHPLVGGVLISGERGSAKSTAVRAFAALLPDIEVVQGCVFNDDPADADVCGECATRRATAGLLGRVRRPVAIVDLPAGASVDSLTGSVDDAMGERVFNAGLLARAHRGILYADEVNLLPDMLVNILLDAAAMGRNHVGRDGISFSHPARFVLVGTMNPEEGRLRPQLLDRFAMIVETEHLADPVQRAEVLRRRSAFERDPEAFVAGWASDERGLRERIDRARQMLPEVRVADTMLEAIAKICSTANVDGLRADLAISRIAVAHAALCQRLEVTVADLVPAAHLALPHRLHARRESEGDDRTGRIEQALSVALVG